MPSDPSAILKKLPDSQVFARDPEDFSKEDIQDTIERLRKVVARMRKARSDEAEVKDLAEKITKTNAAAKKKKTKGVALPADPMEFKL